LGLVLGAGLKLGTSGDRAGAGGEARHPSGLGLHLVLGGLSLGRLRLGAWERGGLGFGLFGRGGRFGLLGHGSPFSLGGSLPTWHPLKEKRALSAGGSDSCHMAVARVNLAADAEGDEKPGY
jgi:hypothetical protein